MTDSIITMGHVKAGADSQVWRRRKGKIHEGEGERVGEGEKKGQRKEGGRDKRRVRDKESHTKSIRLT